MTAKEELSKKYNIVNGNNNIVRKSNDFSRGKYATSTAFALQLVNIAATRIYEEKDGTLSATLTPGELRELMHTKDRASLYKKLAKASKDIMGSSSANNIFMEDGKGNFKYFAFITNAEYQNGVFKITFNKEMKHHMMTIKSSQGYTAFELANIMGLTSPYSIRLYEVLKSEMYKAGKNEIVQKEYWVSELRFTIGLDELTQKMRDAKAKGATWDEVAEMIRGEQKYPGWRNFRRYVLEKAKEELTANANITFDYDVGRGGIGGKTERVIFYIRRNDAKQAIRQQREALIEEMNDKHWQSLDQQMEFDDYAIPEELQQYLGHNRLTGKDLTYFLKDANGDVDKVIHYIESADEQDYIRNYTGWIRDAIRNNYDHFVVSTVQGDANRADYINNLKQELEEETKNPESDTFVRLWKKTKEKPEYHQFLSYLSEHALSEELIEEFYSSKDLVEGYLEWKKGGTPFH